MKQKPLLVTIVTAGSILGFVACDHQSASNSSPAAAPKPTTTTPATRPEFEKLKGRWERPDGGYVLEIRKVDADGKMEASYFNPSPINVSRALAYSESGQIKVFVELTGVNYQGSTYKLALDAKSDQLFGLYFQAKLGQTFDVTFARLK